jgi:hypothetical protein
MNNNHSTQKFRQCHGKPQCGETQREREILLASRKIYQQQQYNFQPREIHLQHTKLPPQYSALENVPNPYRCTTHPKINTLRNVPSFYCTKLLCTALLQQEKPSKLPQKSCQTVPQFSCPLSLVVQTVRIRTIWPPTTTITINTHTEYSLGICAQSLLGNAPSLLPSFLSQALSENLSQILSQCVLHTTQCILF